MTETITENRVKNNKRIPSLDGFRAISIILVLIAHSRFSNGFPSRYYSLAQHGGFGVNIFFVISGFLITYLLLVENEETGGISIKSFYLRRALRIVPVYYLYILFVFAMTSLTKIDIRGNSFLHALTFTSNFDTKIAWVFLHFWTLSVEEQFYLFWPAILILFGKHIKPIIIVFVCYSCIARVISYKFPGHDLMILSPFFSFSDSIFIGAFGGILFFENRSITKLKIFRSYWIQLLMIILIVMFKYFLGHGMFGKVSLPLGNSIMSAAALFLILCYIEPSNSIVFKILNSQFMIHVGVLSYSLYMWQEFFFVEKFDSIFFTFPYNILLIYSVSLISYYLWEKRFLKLKDRFHKKSVPQLNNSLAKAIDKTAVSKRA